MKMDLVYVAYNSSRWIDNCFASVMRSDYDLSNINIYVVDNNSTDDTLDKLNQAKQAYEHQLGVFEIIPSGVNLGFGKGNNLGFSKGQSDIVCFFNIDTELCENTLTELQKEILSSDETTGLWELRQFPYEHPKFYDPLTHETSWSSGAAFAIRRNLFEMLNGFDDGIFMYAEDVDLSWRLRSYGYWLKYCPNSVIYHYSYENAGQIKPNQYLNSVINNLLLRYRFGTLRNIIKGHLIVWRQLTNPCVFPHSRKLLLQKYLQHFRYLPHFLNPSKRGHDPKFKATFLGFDYAPIRNGAFYVNEFPTTKPLVSIIVRTCGRPDVLRETLISLRYQTYPNLEIVVVEDGDAISEKMIQEEFSDLNIRYEATGEKVGRSKAGNRAMAIASGKYLNFLDDDDLFYADHVEVLVKTLERENCRAAYSFAFETPISIRSKKPYTYTVHAYQAMHEQSYNPLILCHHNYIPIQAIMFEKNLFEEYGGMDESVDALEDWDLWLRYSMHTDFACVEKTTSIYRVPHSKTLDKKRQKELDDALVGMREKHKSYVRMISAYDVAMMYEKIR